MSHGSPLDVYALYRSYASSDHGTTQLDQYRRAGPCAPPVSGELCSGQWRCNRFGEAVCDGNVAGVRHGMGPSLLALAAMERGSMSHIGESCEPDSGKRRLPTQQPHGHAGAQYPRYM